MRSLAAFIAIGWFWLMFYGVGPLTSSAQLATAGLWLVGTCLAAALWGVANVALRRPRPAARPIAPAP